MDFVIKKELKYKIRNIQNELKNLIKNIKLLEQNLTKNVSKIPRESLQQIIKKRQKALQNYNDTVRLGFPKDIQFAQKKLYKIIHKEILASRMRDLKNLIERKNLLLNERFVLQWELENIE